MAKNAVEKPEKKREPKAKKEPKKAGQKAERVKEPKAEKAKEELKEHKAEKAKESSKEDTAEKAGEEATHAEKHEHTHMHAEAGGAEETPGRREKREEGAEGERPKHKPKEHEGAEEEKHEHSQKHRPAGEGEGRGHARMPRAEGEKHEHAHAHGRRPKHAHAAERGKGSPSWVELKPQEAIEAIVNLANAGHGGSEIGMMLRDQYGVPDVKQLTGKTIDRILKENGLLPEVPEDLMSLIRKSVALRKHLAKNKKDMSAKRGLLLSVSKIRALVKYYKKRGRLPPEWQYTEENAALLVK